MKTMKKLAGLLLALVMVLALAVPAMAGEGPTATITVPGTPEGHTYAVYQIFVGDVAADDDGKLVLSNVAWGANAKDKDASAAAAAAEISKTLTENDTRYMKDDDENQPQQDLDQLAEIQKYVNLNSEPFATVVSGNSVRVPTGYYLIKDLGEPDGNGGYRIPEGQTASLYMVEIVADVTITVKSGSTTLEKSILEDKESGTPEKLKVNTAAIGDDVKYELEGTLPANYASYKEFKYAFVDTLAEGLTFNADSLTVTVITGETSATLAKGTDYTVETGKDTDENTTITITFSDLKKLTSVTAESKIVANYTATLNKDAVIGSAGNANKAKITYSGDPNNDTVTGETPESEVVTYTTGVQITKVDSADITKTLTGAEFTLTSEDGMNIVLVASEKFTEDGAGEYYLLKDGTYTKEQASDETADLYESTTTKYKKTTELSEIDSKQAGVTVKGMVDENGVVSFTGLNAGHYTLSETKTPSGYNTMEDITFEITFDMEKAKSKFSKKADDNEGDSGSLFAIVNAKQGEVSLDTQLFGSAVAGTKELLTATITNAQGSRLPSTGGIGTTIFTVVGGVLMVGAAILFITKKRTMGD